jgi:hypothetical protein
MIKDPLWNVVHVLPTDYTDYGGTVQRWADAVLDYPDCSAGCRHFHRLHSECEVLADADWGVCANPRGPRAGLLTFEHQAGQGCYDQR